MSEINFKKSLSKNELNTDIRYNSQSLLLDYFYLLQVLGILHNVSYFDKQQN